MKRPRYQICEISSNGDIKHYYVNKKKKISWMSNHRASMLTLEEARKILASYQDIDPERDLFIQAEWEEYFMETDKYDIILPREREERVV